MNRENKIMVSFRMTHYWINKVEALAEEYGVSRSKLLRTLVEGAIEGIEQRKEKKNENR